MAQVVGVKFKKMGKIYYFNSNGIKVDIGQTVIVETPNGKEIGTVALGNRKIADEKLPKDLRKVIKIATPKDLERLEKLKKREKKAFKIFNDKIKKLNLDMKLIDVEYVFDGSKIIFYFIAENRVDFRDLVRELASTFKARIELRQVGVRDETKLAGGIGNCGKTICCATFLKDFQPVTIKMAKDQGLSLNPTKISGTCGRLMCCLNYEQDMYAELLKGAPDLGAYVKTPNGNGTVKDYAILQGNLKVQLDDTTGSPVCVNVKDVIVLGEKNSE